MADEKKSSPAKTDSKAGSQPASKKSDSGGKNGKGDSPRNCFSEGYRSNFDNIDWSK